MAGLADDRPAVAAWWWRSSVTAAPARHRDRRHPARAHRWACWSRPGHCSSSAARRPRPPPATTPPASPWRWPRSPPSMPRHDGPAAIDLVLQGASDGDDDGAAPVPAAAIAHGANARSCSGSPRRAPARRAGGTATARCGRCAMTGGCASWPRTRARPRSAVADAARRRRSAPGRRGCGRSRSGASTTAGWSPARTCPPTPPAGSTRASIDATTRAAVAIVTAIERRRRVLTAPAATGRAASARAAA